MMLQPPWPPAVRHTSILNLAMYNLAPSVQMVGWPLAWPLSCSSLRHEQEKPDPRMLTPLGEGCGPSGAAPRDRLGPTQRTSNRSGGEGV